MAKCVNPEITESIAKLEKDIGTFNRQTGRDYFVLVIPISPDEEVSASLSGKPCPINLPFQLEEVVETMLERRRNVEHGKT